MNEFTKYILTTLGVTNLYLILLFVLNSFFGVEVASTFIIFNLAGWMVIVFKAYLNS